MHSFLSAWVIAWSMYVNHGHASQLGVEVGHVPRGRLVRRIDASCMQRHHACSASGITYFPWTVV